MKAFRFPSEWPERLRRKISGPTFSRFFFCFFFPFHLYQFRNLLSSSLPGESVYARARTRWYFTRFSKIMQIFRNDVAQFRRWIAPLPSGAFIFFYLRILDTTEHLSLAFGAWRARWLVLRRFVLSYAEKRRALPRCGFVVPPSEGWSAFSPHTPSGRVGARKAVDCCKAAIWVRRTRANKQKRETAVWGNGAKRIVFSVDVLPRS